MKKLTLMLASLLVALSTIAQINYGKKLWTVPATNHEAVSAIPDEFITDFAEYYTQSNNADTNTANDRPTALSADQVGVYTTAVRVKDAGTVSAVFQYNGGNIRMDISGVDLVDASGNVVYSDYHFGFAGGQLVNNTYTLSDVAVGDYLMRFFVPLANENVTANGNDSRGTITLTGAWIYPNSSTADSKNFYYIKNVRANKYASYRGDGVQLGLDASAGIGSYWYFEEAGIDDMTGVEAIPEGYKAYWVYNAGNVLPIENVTYGLFAAKDASPWPGKIYYIGVHSNNSNTGLVLRPYNEDGASWNNENGHGLAIGHYSYNDMGSTWQIEVANVTEADIIAQAVNAKNNIKAAITTYISQTYLANATPEQIDAVNEEIDNVSTETLADAVKSVNSADAIKTRFIGEITTTLEAGDRFILKNRGTMPNGSETRGYLRAYSEGNVRSSAVANDLFALDLVWTLVSTETEGQFKLYNERQGVYLGQLPTEDNIRLQYTSDQDAAGVYEIHYHDNIYVSFKGLNQNDNGFIHQLNYDPREVIRYNSGDPGSQWELFAAPFEVTTDKENPVCYAIKSGRGNYYFTLDGNGIKLYNNRDIITDAATHWFFMLDENKNLQIYSLQDKENPMGYITVEDGHTKLTKDSSTAGFVGNTYSIYFNDSRAANYNNTYFAFRPTSGNTFVSNYNGTGSPMGFYNDYNDGGTRVAFEYIGGAALQQKLQAWNARIEYEGEKVGQYNIPEGVKDLVAQGDAVAYANKSNVDDYANILAALNEYEVPSINMPTTGKFYRFQNLSSGKYLTGTVASNNTQLSMLEDTNGNALESVFYYDGTHLVAWQDGKVLGKFIQSDQNETGSWKTVLVSNEKAAEVQFAEANTISKYYIVPSVGRHLHGAYDEANCAGDNQTDNAYTWTISEVEWLPIAGSDKEIVGIYSPVALNVKDNVAAYNATISGSDVPAAKISGGVPANTAVLVKFAEGVVRDEVNGLVYLQVNYDAVATYSDAVAATPLSGSIYATASENGKSYYTTQEHVVEINNSSVETVDFLTYGENVIPGFAAYIALPANDSNPEYFDITGEGFTTGIEEVGVAENAGKTVIYDLQGRKLNAPVKGINIINGKKVLVK